MLRMLRIRRYLPILVLVGFALTIVPTVLADGGGPQGGSNSGGAPPPPPPPMDSSFIAFGNPVIGKDEQRNEELCPLPEAEAEVNSIAISFSPRRTKVLIGREASEVTFRSLASTYSTIHLATHGIIDNRQPLYSHRLLTKSEGDPENDGLPVKVYWECRGPFGGRYSLHVSKPMES